MPKYTNGFGANTPTRLTANQKAISVNNLVAQSLTGKGKNGNRPFITKVAAAVAGAAIGGSYVTVDSRGNVITAYYYSGTKVLTYVVSQSPTGQINWTLPLVSRSSNFYPSSITVDCSDNIIVAGWGSASVPVCIIKISGSGGIIWQKSLGAWSSYTLNSSSNRICTDSAGSIYMVGYTAGYPLVNALKFDSDGNLIWQKYSSHNSQTVASGDISVDSSNNVVLTFGSYQDSGCCGVYNYTRIWRLSSVDGTVVTPTMRYSAHPSYGNVLNVVPLVINPLTGKYYFGSQYASNPTIQVLNADYSIDTGFHNTGISNQEVRAMAFNSLGQLFVLLCNRSNPTSYNLWMYDSVNILAAPTLLKTTSLGGAVVQAYEIKATNDAVYVSSTSANQGYIEKIVIDRGSITDNRVSYSNTSRVETNLFSVSSINSSDSSTASNSAYPSTTSDIAVDDSFSKISINTYVMGS